MESDEGREVMEGDGMVESEGRVRSGESWKGEGFMSSYEGRGSNGRRGAMEGGMMEGRQWGCVMEGGVVRSGPSEEQPASDTQL